MKKQIVLMSLLAITFGYAQEDKKTKISEEKQIEEVTIKKTKKAVEQKADRTIFDFSEQEHLNTGTALEGIRKLPGMMNSDLTGMSYQGKALAVFMDGRPMNINSTELNAFLEGLPANAIEKIEVITNPGAEFPATGGGAIMNIITSKSARSYLTATYSGNYSFSNYDKLRNKTNQSILLNSKNKWFGWQLNTGMRYGESYEMSGVSNLSETMSNEIDRGYFLRSAVSFDLGKDRLLLNYNLNRGNDDEMPFSIGKQNGLSYERRDKVDTKRLRQEAVATYQKRFEDAGKKLDFKLSYTKMERDFNQDNHFYTLNSMVQGSLPSLANSSDVGTVEFRINYTQDIPLLDKGKIHLGGLYERMDYRTIGNGIKNLDYERQTISSFAELQTSKGKWDFVLGVRGEDYDIGGITYNAKTQSYDDLIAFKKYKFFPNASVQYNISRMMNVSLNYNKKISLPRVNMLNPNNFGYDNGNFASIGNANLQPTIYDNFGFKFSAFNYFFVNYDFQLADNSLADNMVRIGDRVLQVRENIPTLKSHNASFGFPLPLAMFKKPLKEILYSNPDKMSYIFFVVAYQYQEMPKINNKGLWYLNANGQIVLPKELKLNLNYTIIPKNAGYYYYTISEPLQHMFNVTLSKKFLRNQLSVSLFANDIFNTTKMMGHPYGQESRIEVYAKRDSRRFGISINYKIPTKNKLAKETPNILLDEKKEEGGLLN